MYLKFGTFIFQNILIIHFGLVWILTNKTNPYCNQHWRLIHCDSNVRVRGKSANGLETYPYSIFTDVPSLCASNTVLVPAMTIQGGERHAGGIKGEGGWAGTYSRTGCRFTSAVGNRGWYKLYRSIDLLSEDPPTWYTIRGDPRSRNSSEGTRCERWNVGMGLRGLQCYG